jgi:hypothetical protein
VTILKSARRAADHFHVIPILGLAGILAITAAARQHSALRSERCDEPQAQRGRTKARQPGAPLHAGGFIGCNLCPALESRSAPYVGDHIIPLNPGGPDAPGNIQVLAVACRPCCA